MNISKLPKNTEEGGGNSLVQNGLLVFSDTANIGDYIQSCAQEQFLDTVDVYVERERLNSFHSDIKTKVIMNGWFMEEPQNFPPSEDIAPLFVSFHISPREADKILTKQGVAYLKKYQPIGTRDKDTQRLLESKGIKSYFTGCLTTTLGYKFQSEDRNNQIIFVDPYYELSRKGKNSLVRCLWRSLNLLRHIYAVLKLYNKLPDASCVRSQIYKFSKRIDKMFSVAEFYHVYSKLFTDKVLYNATYITHTIEQSHHGDYHWGLEYAKELINMYAKAQFVVTSRIHCALPCLGLQTPILFVTSNAKEILKSEQAANRFDGLIDWFQCLKFTPRGLVVQDDEVRKKMSNGKIGHNFTFFNKTTFLPFRDKLKEIVSTFV